MQFGRQLVLKTSAGRALLIAVAIAIIAVAAVALLLNRTAGDEPSDVTADAGAAQLVRENSHRLNDVPDARVTLVEFLDFECEACRAAQPIVEELRTEYGDRVQFVVRYFPLSAHYNSERAARAVESAAQQAKFEQMYQKMFDTQSEWGEKRTPADDVFRGFATELGLDMTKFDAAYNDPATAQRVRVDLDDGKALGVRGTPTFFINGEQIRVRGPDDLRSALEEALK
jgi:protein-disulfide isomerase